MHDPAPSFLICVCFPRPISTHLQGIIMWEILVGQCIFRDTPVLQASQLQGGSAGAAPGEHMAVSVCAQAARPAFCELLYSAFLHFLLTQIISSVSLKGWRPTIPSECPPPLAELMQSCWDADAQARCTGGVCKGCAAAAWAPPFLVLSCCALPS